MGFYHLSETERLALTDKAIRDKGAVKMRWEQLGAGEAEGWNPRVQAAAALLEGCASVVDIGCGTMILERALWPSVTYIPVDIVARDERTIVVDLTASEPPVIKADAVSALGLLEYLHDVPAFLVSIARSYPVLVTSYNPMQPGASLTERRAHAWVNDYSSDELEAVFRTSGWRIDATEEFGSQVLWRLTSDLL